MNTFCVYEHWRSDLNVCFYVGKGTRRRAFSLERNDRHDKVVRKLFRIGANVEVRIVQGGLTEMAAFALERERISFWRTKHDHLTNMTDGGDGTSGYTFSPEQREKIRAKALGRKVSEETRQKMSAAHTGQKRSEATKIRMSEAAKISQKKRFEKEKRDNPEKLLKKMIGMSRKAASDEKVRRRRSQNAKKLWQDPEYRQRCLAARTNSIIE